MEKRTLLFDGFPHRERERERERVFTQHVRKSTTTRDYYDDAVFVEKSVRVNWIFAFIHRSRRRNHRLERGKRERV